MEFASPYTFVRADEAEEEVAAEELDLDLRSAAEGFSAAATPASAHCLAPPIPGAPASKRAYRQQADTNVVAVRFGSLATDADDIFAGDPVICKGCKAILSVTSTLSKEAKHAAPAAEEVKELKLNERQQFWNCEFCAAVNVVDVEPEEVPTGDVRDYQLEPAPEAKDEDKSDGMVIFVVDTSGSMCMTTEVPGSFKIKGAAADDLDLDGMPPDLIAEIRASRRHTATTWVSRLQCVQASIDQQIERWSKDSPGKKVGLITFSDDVTVIGDGTGVPEVVAGDKLSDQKALQDIGAARALDGSVSDTGKSLSEKLWALRPSGKTALGPALCIAVSMASKQRGSTVVVCTDGKANVGLGALDGIADDADKLVVEQWYEAVGDLAKLNGVAVSVISIIGTDCALEDLGKVAEITGGNVERVNPVDMTKDFASLMAAPVIATNVSCVFLLHRGLMFRGEAGVDKEQNQLRREIGNVTEDTEVTFEYSVADKATLEKFAGLKSLPFQVQIYFTKLDGMKCMRVLSKSQLITTDRAEAEKGARLEVIAANAAQKGAKLAEQGAYQEAMAFNRAWGRVLRRSAQTREQQGVYESWVGQTERFDSSIQRQHMRMEMASPGYAAAFAPMAFPAGLSSALTPAPAASRAARAMRSDADYAGIRAQKITSSRMFTTPTPRPASGPGVPAPAPVSSTPAPDASAEPRAPQAPRRFTMKGFLSARRADKS